MATHRISIDIEEDDHKYLRMCCLKLGVTMKEFVISCTLDRVDACEDKWMLERWEKDGTRKEIEEERNNPERTTFRMEKVNEKFFFTEMQGEKVVGLPHEI